MTTQDVLTTLAKLPPRCFITEQGSRGPRVLEIVRGVPGYVIVETLSSSDALNAALPDPPTHEQLEAMQAGSMFGWHLPCADPDFVRERNAREGARP